MLLDHALLHSIISSISSEPSFHFVFHLGLELSESQYLSKMLNRWIGVFFIFITLHFTTGLEQGNEIIQ